MIGQLNKKKRENNWENEKEECDSRVKIPKWQSIAKIRIFSKTHGQSQQKNEKSITKEYLKPLWGPQSLPKLENLNLLLKNVFPKIPESIIVGLDAYQITIFRDEKESS